MSVVPPAKLRKEVEAILKDADLGAISARDVRFQVEAKLKCSLKTRKREFDKIVMDVLLEQNPDDDDDDDDDCDLGDLADFDEFFDFDTSVDSSDDGAQNNEPPQEERPKPTQPKAAAKKERTEPKKSTDKKKKAAGNGTGTGRKGTGRKSTRPKGTGYTRPCQLSPELSALMGAKSLPRHEVVKRVWAIVKERNLFDPTNRQFAICDDELMKVMKIKRFRTFGMMKLLKVHLTK